MRYFFFNPFTKQYYFPEGYKNYPLFGSFYTSYTIAGSLLWFFWRNFSFFNNLCLAKDTEKLLPITQIKAYVPASSILAFNLGTKGVEQKTTILGIDKTTKDEFFIKFAESSIARINVNNEGQVLQQLNHLNFVPKLQRHVNTSDYTLILTNTLKGKRLNWKPDQNELLTKLKLLANQSIKTNINYLSELETCFAHGDFCPWNMMDHNGKLMLFDWEMAANYPKGFDLFTHIFQTSFHLKPKKSISELLKENNALIKSYFNFFSIVKWQDYLRAFASIKLELETQKKDKSLMFLFQQLESYAKKI